MQRAFNASELLPYLYLGSAADAANLDALKSHGITHVLNVADNVKNHHPTHFIYRNLMVKDRNDDAGISRVFSDAIDFVTEVQAHGGKVLVHCLMGQNRSASIALALLMSLPPGRTLRDSYALMLKLRPWTSLTDVNKQELTLYETKLKGAASMKPADW